MSDSINSLIKKIAYKQDCIEIDKDLAQRHRQDENNAKYRALDSEGIVKKLESEVAELYIELKGMMDKEVKITKLNPIPKKEEVQTEQLIGRED